MDMHVADMRMRTHQLNSGNRGRTAVGERTDVSVMAVNERKFVVQNTAVVVEVPSEGEGATLIAAQQITARETTEVSCCFLNVTLYIKFAWCLHVGIN